MDNFTNDFYDEPNPTPGYENHRSRESTDRNLWPYVLGIGGIIIVAVASVYHFRKKR